MKPLCENRIPSPDNYRKVSKPLIEKKRRARINASLDELKQLLETALGAEIPRDSKMEKADILELAVKHLKRVNRQMMKNSPMGQYRFGYGECATETSRFLGHVHGLDTKLRGRLVNHLACTVNQNAVANNHQMTSYNVMTSTNSRQASQDNSNLTSPLYVKISDSNGARQFRPIRNVNDSDVMSHQPIQGLLMVSDVNQTSPSTVWRPW